MLYEVVANDYMHVDAEAFSAKMICKGCITLSTDIKVLKA